MLITVIVTVTILFACTVGATVGFGGGVIIKPVLDSMNFCTIDVVNFISACAVFAMSISSLLRQKKQKRVIDKKLALLVSVGAVAGGFCGNSLFSLAVSAVQDTVMKAVQAAIIMLFVGFALFYINKENAKTFHIKNPTAMVIAGLLLGTLNSFLGIGGGPINMTALFLLFSLSVKEGAVYSIFIVFFCQCSNLVTLFCKNQFVPFRNYAVLVVFAIVSAVAGGIIGSILNKKWSEKTVRMIFSAVMVTVFGINLYNLIRGFL